MKVRIPFLFLCFLFTATAVAQKPAISGRIRDENDQPVAGATVILKRSGARSVSDAEGGFSLASPPSSDSLTVSCIGYITGTYPVTANTRTLEIRIQTASLHLQEVTISTGYQHVSKERATGSFEKIGPERLAQRVSTGVLERLEGQSSVTFDKVSTRPALTIRGYNSINSSNDPLLVVDNFPYEGELNTINPNDVEDITLLKDAAASSIWGTRAANGVIVITTKRGKLNQPVTSSFTGSVKVTNKPGLHYIQSIRAEDMAGLETFLFSKGFYTAKEASDSRPPLSDVVETLIALRDGQLSDADAQARINALKTNDIRDDFSRYMYSRGVNQQYAASLKGGTADAAWSFFAGHDRNSDVLENVYSRLNLRATGDVALSRRLRLSASLAYAESNTRTGRPEMGTIPGLMPYSRLMDDAGQALPLARYRKTFTDTAGAGKLLDWNYYPATDYRNDFSVSKLFNTRASASLNYKIWRGLEISALYQYERQQEDGRHEQGAESFYTRDLINRFSQVNAAAGTVKYVVPPGGIVDDSGGLLEAHNARGQLNYNTAWGNHSVAVIAGMEIRSVENRNNTNRAYGYNGSNLTVANVDYANPYTTYIRHTSEYIPQYLSYGETDNHYISEYANASWTYHSRYILSGSIRRDASNLFGVSTNDKWQPLWSSGLAWKLSDEPFYRLDFLPVMRLRLTYGLSGSVDQSKSAVTTISYSSPASYTNLPNAIISQFKNPDLRWEKTAMLNGGLDFSSKNSVVSGSMEYYYKWGKDLFGQSPVDPTTGLGTTYLLKNVADMEGWGMDLLLNGRLAFGNLRWNPGIILNYNRNKVTDYLQPELSSYLFISGGQVVSALKGYPVYSVFSYRWEGLDANGNPQGLLNGEKSTDYGGLRSAPVENLEYSGPATPKVSGAFTNSLSWKRFNLSASLSWKLGYVFRRASVNYTDLLQMSYFGQGTADYALRWQNPGDEATTSVPAFVYPDNGNRSSFYSNSSVLVEKGDHIRLQYVNLEYDLKGIGKSRKIPALRVFISASDLGIIWRANKRHLDPDYSANVIPPARSISLGIRSGF